MSDGLQEAPVSAWLRLWSIGLSLGLATLGAAGVFALVLHGEFLNGAADAVAEFLRPRPGLQAFLASTPLIASIMLGIAAGRKRKRRQQAEELAAMRKAVGLD